MTPSPVDLAACPYICSRCRLSAPALLPIISRSSLLGWNPTNDAYREVLGPLTGFDGKSFPKEEEVCRELGLNHGGKVFPEQGSLPF